MKIRITNPSSAEPPEVIATTRCSSEAPCLPAPGFPPLLAASSRDTGVNNLRDSQIQHAVSSSALLFLLDQLLTKLCLFFSFLCQYFLQQPKQTLSNKTAHQSQNQKKRKKMKTSLHTCGTKHRSSMSEGKRGYALYPCLSPLLPYLTQRNPGFFSRSPCQRVKDTSCSKCTALPALLHRAYWPWWCWVTGLKVGHTRACVRAGIGSAAVRSQKPGTSKA